MNMHDCVCGASALYTKLTYGKRRSGSITITVAPTHTIACSKQCGERVRRDTATETKKAWNARMKKLKADAAAAPPAPEVAT